MVAAGVQYLDTEFVIDTPTPLPDRCTLYTLHLRYC